MLHHTIGHRKVGGGVVELDVAREGRLAGEQHWRGEDEEDREPDADQPRVRAFPPPPGEHETGARQHADERASELGRRIRERCELRRHDHEGEAGGHDEPGRQPRAARSLEQAAAAFGR